MVFWTLAAVMSLLAVLALLPALLGKRSIQLESVRERNIAIARERKTEIESAFESGELNELERDAAEHDLEASLAADLDETAPTLSANKSPIILTAGIAILVPVFAIGMYLATGHGSVPTTTAAAANTEMPSLDSLVGGLEAKVAQNPEDIKGNTLLAQTYMRLGRFADAIKTFKKLRTLSEDSPEMLATYVDALVMNNQGRFTPEMEQLLDQALELNPNHPQSLWLGGMAKEELGKPQQAITYWQRLKPVLANSPDDLAELQAMIDSVLSNSGQPGEVSTAATPEPAGSANSTEPADNSGLTLNVKLSTGLSAVQLKQVEETDVVYVFARAETGPPMPLAAVQKTVADLPFTVTLNDAMAMMPAMSLSQFPKVVVSARISLSGEPTAQPGDIQSELVPTPNSSKTPIELTISQIVE